MTIAFWCILIAALMPYLWTGIAKKAAPRYNNRKPRIILAELSGRGQRANWAHLNSFEAFPPFAAAVIIASYIGKIDLGLLDNLAMMFIVCRVLHGVFYIFDKQLFRTLIWIAGIGTWVSMLVLSA